MQSDLKIKDLLGIKVLKHCEMGFGGALQEVSEDVIHSTPAARS